MNTHERRRIPWLSSVRLRHTFPLYAIAVAHIFILSCTADLDGRATQIHSASTSQLWKALWQEPPEAFIEERNTQRLDFSQESTADVRSLGNGWIAEGRRRLAFRNGYIWCPSLVADLHVTITRPRALKLTLLLMPNFAPSVGAQRVDVVWNNTRLGPCEFETEAGWKFVQFQFVVPEHVQHAGKNTITFLSRYAVSVKQVVGRGDGRQFAFALSHLSLDSTADGPEGAPASPGSQHTMRMTFTHDSILQPPGTLLKFPVRLPRAERVVFSMDAPRLRAPGTSWRVRLRTNEPTAAGDRPMFSNRSELPTTGPLEFDLTAFQGTVVEIVLDTTDAPTNRVEWRKPAIRVVAEVEAAAAPPEFTRSEGASYRADNVVLIICDATPASTLGCYGYMRDTSPCIDTLAREGVTFTRAYSAAPYTYSSSWSLVTSLYPFQHRATETPLRVPDEAPRLQQVLSAAGIFTGLGTAQHWVSPKTGIGELFDEFLPAFESVEILQTGAAPEILTAAAVAFLRERRNGRFFLYLHYRPPHEPYFPPPAYSHTMTLDPFDEVIPTREFMGSVKNGRRVLSRNERLQLRARYDENMRGVDAEVGRVIDCLNELDLREKTLVIFTSDHGEAFLEHDFLSHGSTLYEEVVRVPLVLWGSGIENVLPKTVDDLVSTVNLFPTICGAMGVAAPDTLAGRNMLEPLNLPADEVRVFSQGGFQEKTHTYDPREAYWFDRHKLIVDNTSSDVEVYDLERDPEERSNLALIQPVLTDYLQTKARAWRLRQQSLVLQTAPTRSEEKRTLEEVESLKALGYL